ncbi:MAG: O-antigen ligase family protein [Clostridiaceae bacterium]|nr:O-antigen ligase family protein [Clostridiaceae bacterium]
MILRINKTKINPYVMMLGVIYILEQNFLYLLPQSDLYEYGAYLLILVLLLITFFINNGVAGRGNFTFIILATILLSMIATVVEVANFSSTNMLLSFLKQGQWWINGFIYIISFELLRTRKVEYHQLESLLVTLGIIQLVIGISQYFLSGFVTFTYVDTTTRLSSVRFRYPMVLMDFVCLWAASNFFKGKKRLLSVVLVIAVLFEALFVEQFRSTAIGLVVVLIIGYLSWRKVPTTKIAVGVAALVAVILLYLNSSFLQESIAFMFSTDTSLSMRTYLRSFLVENFMNSPIWGKGWVSSAEAFDYASTPYRLNINSNVFSFADGGIFSTLYCYGVLGLLWIIALWKKMLTTGYRILKRTNQYLYLLFPLFFLVTIYIDVHWRIHNQFYVLAMFCAILEYKYKETMEMNLDISRQ